MDRLTPRSSTAINLASRIFLYGPPFSGKSTIAQQLAGDLSLPFHDLDEIIEHHAGLTIPNIFAAEGEHGFRARERAQLLEVLEQEWGVIALGGGTLLDPRNRDRVEKAGPVLCLSAPIEQLQHRWRTSPGTRPLLQGAGDENPHGERLNELLAARASHYASFSDQVDVGGKSPQEVSRDVQMRLGAFHVTGMVPLGGRLDHAGGSSARSRLAGYDVRIQNHSLDSLGDLLTLHALDGPVAVVSDENVSHHYMSRVVNSLQNAGYTAQAIIIPPGEASKNMATVSDVWQQFISAGIGRRSTVVALGGGVIGDLTGFAAATFMRGVPWLILPTSLLAMVDASLGGKTGVDLAQGKNLVGAFHAPQFVLTDPGTLVSLPKEEIVSGLAEVVKAGIIADPFLFDLCSQGLGSLSVDWREVIRRAAAVKIQVIEADPYEAGLRKVLNLGHTIGHAVELVSEFKLKHGQAISIGMSVEASLSERIGLADRGLADQIISVLSRLGLPVEIPGNLSKPEILNVMKVDKKRSKGQVRFALPVRLGEVKPDVVVEDLSTLGF